MWKILDWQYLGQISSLILRCQMYKTLTLACCFKLWFNLSIHRDFYAYHYCNIIVFAQKISRIVWNKPSMVSSNTNFHAWINEKASSTHNIQIFVHIFNVFSKGCSTIRGSSAHSLVATCAQLLLQELLLRQKALQMKMMELEALSHFGNLLTALHSFIFIFLHTLCFVFSKVS